MLQEFFNALFFIFMAEMGDKTQMLAFAFATKYPLKKVLVGVFLGSLLNHGLAVVLGTYLTRFVPIEAIQLLAALAFIAFGLWTLKIDAEEDEEKTSAFGPVVTVGLAFFLGELGDKTQLTAITLSTSTLYPLALLAGSVVGMLLTSALGIFVGGRLGKRIPKLPLKMASAMIFIFFGVLGLKDAIPAQYITSLSTTLFLAVLGLLVVLLSRNALNMIRAQKREADMISLQLLTNTQRIQVALDGICFAEKNSHACQRAECAIYTLKQRLKEAQKNQQFLTDEAWKLPIYKIAASDVCGLKESLLETLEACLRCNPQGGNYVGNQTRQVLENLYFGETIPYENSRIRYYQQVQKRDPQFFYDLKANY